jgi:hypothetical protein
MTSLLEFNFARVLRHSDAASLTDDEAALYDAADFAEDEQAYPRVSL